MPPSDDVLVAQPARIPVPAVTELVVRAHIADARMARKLAAVCDELIGLCPHDPNSGTSHNPLAWFLRDLVDALLAYADQHLEVSDEGKKSPQDGASQ